MLRGSRAFSGKIHRPLLAHVVPTLVARISWRRLVAKVGTFENKKVHKHLHLWPLGPHRRRLAVRSGTSKGSTISHYGCSTFGSISHRGTIERKRRKRTVNTHHADHSPETCWTALSTLISWSVAQRTLQQCLPVSTALSKSNNCGHCSVLCPNLSNMWTHHTARN